jgi:hypothetical protein
VSATGVSSRRRRHNAAEAKARRQRRLAIGGAVLLAVVLVVQLPRTLDMLGGGGGDSSATPAASAPVTPPAPAAGKTGRAPKFLNSTPRIDPFGPRTISDGEAAPVAVAAPAGARDPFADNTPAAAAPKPAAQPYVPKTIVIGTPRAGRAPTTGYIVILASVPESNGKRAAEQIASRAESKGIDGVRVIQSSTRKSLRAGFYAVYVGLFKSQGAAASAATRMHSRGYGDAYIRQLVRY